MTQRNRPHHSPELLQAALIKFIKLIKTVRFYPAGHPTLKLVGDETLEAFRPLLRDGDLPLSVRKDRILYGDETIGAGHAGTRGLAHFLFARRVQQLLFLPELSAHDLTVFARNIMCKTGDIQERGGLQKVLLADRATGIWINELDLSVIRAAKEQWQKQSGATSVGQEEPLATDNHADGQIKNRDGIASEATGDAPLDTHLLDGLSIEQILSRLPEEPSEERFRQLLNRLPILLRQYLVEPGLPQVLKTFRILANLYGSRHLNHSRRNDVLQCLNRITEPGVIEFLINTLCTRGLPRDLREQNMQTLVFLRHKTVRPLIRRLTIEKDTLARKLLSTSLAALGSVAVPELLKALQDDRWYVLRNIVAILGEIGEQNSVAYLQPLLEHQDLRIARETIRALARIGGDQALKSLLLVVDRGRRELYPQAILALGVMKNPGAVSKLVKIMKSRDPFMKKIELKTSAIKALGRIGSPAAAPALERLAKRRPLWGKKRFAALRILAIAALGHIGAPSSRPVLEHLCRDRDARIAQIASRTLNQWPET